jgi:hypothetical protein
MHPGGKPTERHLRWASLAESPNIPASFAPSMAPHQFHIGQTVYLRRSAFTRDAAPGIYEIRAVLPEEDGRRQYKIKSLIEPHERVVSEQELSEAKDHYPS